MPRQLDVILMTIRLVESGNTYDIPPNRGGASGAYQYIDSTWNNHRGYPSAYLAPDWIQDERALSDVEGILWTWHGDVSMVPVIWYYPKASRTPALMDEVPIPSAGNRLTVREYQHRWLDVLEYINGSPLTDRALLLPPSLRYLSGTPPEPAFADGDEPNLAFPVLGGALISPPIPCEEGTCGSGTDAIIYGQQLQPILAAHDGVVTHIESGESALGTRAITITDAVGRTYRYAGLNDDTPGTNDGEAPDHLSFTALGRVGASVRAGQIIGFMGNTDPMPANERRGIGEDDAIWPHLRFTVRNHAGIRLDTDSLVVSALFDHACHVAIGPWSVPQNPELDSDDVDVDAILNGGWSIHSDGTVTAYGRSTLILPPAGCAWAPNDSFGPGESGNQAPEGWYEPVTIPARYWVSGSLDDKIGAAGFFRRG